MQGTSRFTAVACGCVALLATALNASAAPRAICVPWVPSAPEIPHYSYSGAEVQLMGIARNLGGNPEYYWDFGDGNTTAWAPIVDRYNLGATHVYNGAVGQDFVATLHVRDATGEDTDVFRVRLHESSDPRIQEHLDVRINMAIDKGLWWLHTEMVRATYPAGEPGYEQPYGYWYYCGDAGQYTDYSGATTGLAVTALELHGSRANGDYDGDPYVETVQRGINHLLAGTLSQDITDGQAWGDPDVNGNGIGLVVNPPNDSYGYAYQGGMGGMAITNSGAPTRVAAVGGPDVYGRTYAEISQDLCDYLAWGLTDYGWGRGGWYYYPNAQDEMEGEWYGYADGSNNQWPFMTMIAAEENMGSIIPEFVRDEQRDNWLVYTQNTDLDGDNGAFGYTSDSGWLNNGKTGAGLINLHWCDVPLNDPRIESGFGYIYRHWGDNGQSPPFLGQAYHMYGVMKACRQPTPDVVRIFEYDYNSGTPTGNSFDWYYYPYGQDEEGLAHYLVRTQNATGYFIEDPDSEFQLCKEIYTAFGVLILYKGVSVIPPEAVICDCDGGFEYNPNQDIPLDGTCSYHPDGAREIVLYEWDFDYDGATFDVDAVGPQVTIVDGYPATGLYTVALRVTDDNPFEPQTELVTCDINITEDPTCPNADAGGPYDGFVGMPVTVDGSGSWDPDGDIVDYEWDLDNDGQFDDAFTVTAEWTWNIPGIYTIALLVRDANGCEDIDYATVDVGNHAPVSDPGGPYTAPANGTITLDGSASYDIDPGDSIVSYLWDLDNDGEFDDDSGMMVDFTAGDTPGQVHTVCLRVEDTFGEYDIECTTVTVATNQAPICDAGGPYDSECAGQLTLIELDGTGSDDPDGDELEFLWSTDCAGVSIDDPTSPTPVVTVDSSVVCPDGLLCTLTLTVDDGTVPASCETTVAVSDTLPPTFDFVPEDVSVVAGPDCTASVEFEMATATDTCGDVSVQGLRDDGAPLDDPYPAGDTIITWTATDACGNTAEESQTITVLSDAAMTLDVEITQECLGPDTEIIVELWMRDICEGGPGIVGFQAYIEINPELLTLLGEPVSFYTEDPFGLVTIPIEMSPDGIIELAAGIDPMQGQEPAFGDHLLAELHFTTQSGASGLTNIFFTDHAPPSRLVALNGINVEPLTLADTPEFYVDGEAPELTCPDDVTQECDLEVPPPAIDREEFETLGGTLSDYSETLGHEVAFAWMGDSEEGICPTVISRTYSALDCAGNLTECVQTFTIQDTVAPEFTFVPDDINIPADLGGCTVMVDVGWPEAIDNCDLEPVIAGERSDGLALDDPYPVGLTTITWTVTDICGNEAEATQTVTVDANAQLVLEFGGDDDCLGPDQPLVVYVWMRGICDPGPAAAGFQAFLQFDPEALLLEPEPVSFYTDEPFGLPVLPILATPEGEIDISSGINQFEGQQPVHGDWLLAELHFTALAGFEGLTSVDFRDHYPPTRITDLGGNEILPLTLTGTAEFYLDGIAPVITCPPNITQECDIPLPQAATTSDEFLDQGGTVFDDSLGFGYDFDVEWLGDESDGVCPTHVWRTYRIIDCADNASECVQHFTLIDTTAPVFTTFPDDITVYADAGGCTAIVEITAPTAEDNCDAEPQVFGLRADGLALTDPYPAGDTIITWVAKDVCCNRTEQTQVITVEPFNQMLIAVELKDVHEPVLDRCITFDLHNTVLGTSETVEAVLTFAEGLAEGPTVLVPCGAYDCIQARDRLHTLTRTDTDHFGIDGTNYVVNFTDQSGAGGDDDSLIGGNLNDDEYIDILDFGVFALQWNSNFGTGDTTCETAAPHADISGNGIVFTEDFTFIQVNFLVFSEPNCGVAAMALGGDRHDGGPVKSITVAELYGRGMGDLAIADLTGDGILDVNDIVAFMHGQRPGQQSTPWRSSR